MACRASLVGLSQVDAEERWTHRHFRVRRSCADSHRCCSEGTRCQPSYRMALPLCVLYRQASRGSIARTEKVENCPKPWHQLQRTRSWWRESGTRLCLAVAGRLATQRMAVEGIAFAMAEHLDVAWLSSQLWQRAGILSCWAIAFKAVVLVILTATPRLP